MSLAILPWILGQGDNSAVIPSHPVFKNDFILIPYNFFCYDFNKTKHTNKFFETFTQGVRILCFEHIYFNEIVICQYNLLFSVSCKAGYLESSGFKMIVSCHPWFRREQKLKFEARLV